jgi:hypothetical protein
VRCARSREYSSTKIFRIQALPAEIVVPQVAEASWIDDDELNTFFRMIKLPAEILFKTQTESEGGS